MSAPNLKSVYDSIDFAEEVPPASPTSSQSSRSDSEVASALSSEHQSQMQDTQKAVNNILTMGTSLAGGGKKKAARAPRKKKTPVARGGGAKAAKKAAGATPKAGKRKRAAAGGGQPRKKRDMTNHPFMKHHQLSQELQQVPQFNGVTQMRRPHVVRELWTYIKSRNLQDPTNKRNIRCDAALERVFGKKEVNMFEMQKILNSHLRAIE